MIRLSGILIRKVESGVYVNTYICVCRGQKERWWAWMADEEMVSSSQVRRKYTFTSFSSFLFASLYSPCLVFVVNRGCSENCELEHEKKVVEIGFKRQFLTWKRSFFMLKTALENIDTLNLKKWRNQKWHKQHIWAVFEDDCVSINFSIWNWI
jgi:hypothetical protein